VRTYNSLKLCYDKKITMTLLRPACSGTTDGHSKNNNMAKPSSEKIETFLQRGVERIVKKDSLLKKLRSGKKLRVKHGVDPTTPNLHLGHAVVYLKLRELQEMGHTIVFLIGDFTARLGDPTEKLEIRQFRTKKEVRAIAKDYVKQVSVLLDPKKTEIRYNSEWYDKMTPEDLLRLMSNFTCARMLERDMFQDRIKQDKDIGLHEPVYPALQGYDSVQLKSDITVCGSDQLFNELRGRDLQKKEGQAPQDVVTTAVLVGTDGTEKMSQSLGNHIGMQEKPAEQYGKVMSIPDTLIESYFELATRVPLEEIATLKRANPREAKRRLAREVATLYHSKSAAAKAEKEFDRVFKEKKTPSDMPTVRVAQKEITLLDLLVATKLASSKAEAKRLVEQKGIRIDGVVQDDWQGIVKTKTGMIVQAGKRRFVKLR